jgi:Spy/CpxP family protein refolding chaperone
MKKNALGFLIIFISLIFFAPLAFSDPGDRTGFAPPGYRPGAPLGRTPERPPWGPPDGYRWEGRPGPESFGWSHLAAIELNEGQIEKVQAIEQRMAKEEILKGAELEVTRIELQEILGKDPVDLKAVEAKLKKREALMTEIQLASIKAGEQIKALLTSSQKEALKNFQRMGPRGESFLPGHRRMPPPGEQEEEGRPGGKPGTPRK